jgi:hypothetical protein
MVRIQGMLLVDVSTVPWWQVVAGIIAIPAGVVGLYFLFLQIKKTRLESKKLREELSTPEVDKENRLEQINAGGTVSVASKAKIKNSKVGTIKGVQGRSGMSHNVEQEVSVFNKGEMENSVAGDIVGIEYQVFPPEEL